MCAHIDTIYSHVFCFAHASFVPLTLQVVNVKEREVSLQVAAFALVIERSLAQFPLLIHCFLFPCHHKLDNLFPISLLLLVLANYPHRHILFHSWNDQATVIGLISGY